MPPQTPPGSTVSASSLTHRMTSLAVFSISLISTSLAAWSPARRFFWRRNRMLLSNVSSLTAFPAQTFQTLNRSVDRPPVEYSTPFKLEKKLISTASTTQVKLDIELTNRRLKTTLDWLNKRSDKTSDVIYIIFWAAPVDIGIRASLTRNKENTTTSSIPGTNGALAPLTPLIGGTDKFSTNLLETIIFMAPTLIDPSSENQPHSAFRTRLRLKMQEAS